MLSGQKGLQLCQEFIDFGEKVTQNFDNYSANKCSELQQKVSSWLLEADNTIKQISLHMINCPNSKQHVEEIGEISQLVFTLTVSLSTLKAFDIRAQSKRINKSSLN